MVLQTCVPEEVTLTWNPITGATAYTLQIDTLDGFTDPWIEASAIAVTSYTPAALANEQQYYWRVAGTRGSRNRPLVGGMEFHHKESDRWHSSRGRG